MTEEFLEEENSSSNILEFIDRKGEQVFSIDDEIEDTKYQIDTLMKVYSSIVQQINEKRISHISKITDLKNEYENVSLKLESQLNQQKENQKLEMDQLLSDCSSEIDLMEEEKRTILDVPYVYLEKEVAEYRNLNKMIEEQQNYHQTQIDTIKSSSMMQQPVDNSKQNYEILLFEIERLQDAISRIRDRKEEMVRGLEFSSANSKQQHENTMKRLQNELIKREKAMDMHKQSMLKLIDKEKKYAQLEISHLEKNIQFINDVKKKLIKNCTAQVSQALQSIYNAERSIEEANSEISKSMPTEITDNDIERLKVEQERLTEELENIKNLNQKIANSIL